MTDLTPADLRPRLEALGLFGLIACWEHIADKPWLQQVLAIEERERKKRSLERRLRHSRVASFKPMTDFDWSWPKRINREAIDELQEASTPKCLSKVAILFSRSPSSNPATTPSSSVPTASAKP